MFLCFFKGRDCFCGPDGVAKICGVGIDFVDLLNVGVEPFDYFGGHGGRWGAFIKSQNERSQSIP